MKDFFKALGKALLYFLVYFGFQMIVSVAFSIGYSILWSAKIAATGEMPDMEQMTQQITEGIMSQAMTMTFIAGILALITYWIIFLIRKKSFFQEVTLRSIPVVGMIAVVLMGISFNIIISVVIATIPFPESWSQSYAQNSSVLSDGNVVVAWLATVLMAPVLEEVVFRGLIYKRLKTGMPVVVAAIISSVVFGLMHGTIIWGMYAFVLGVVLIIVYERFHSLLANILLHMGFNLTGMGLQLFSDMSETAGWVVFAVCVVVFIGTTYWMIQITKQENREIPIYAE